MWLDELIDRLRTKDLRWGDSGKRGNLDDLSLDIVGRPGHRPFVCTA